MTERSKPNRTLSMDQGPPPAARASAHRWLESYPPDVDWAAEIPAAPAWKLMADAVARFADRPCVDFLDRRFTYREIGDLVDRAAKGLAGLGVKSGTKVGLFLPNCPYSVIFYFAVLKAGGTVVNFNPLYAERELAAQIEDSETDIMVTLDLATLHDKIAALLGGTRLRQVIVCPMQAALPFPRNLLFALAMNRRLTRLPADGRHSSFRRLVDNDGALEPRSIDPRREIALLQYTGGTTGTPKGAMLTHANIHANAVQCARWFTEVRPGGERMVGVLPLFHVFAMTAVMNWSLLFGAEMILLPRFQLERLLRAIHRKRATAIAAVPTILTAINNFPQIKRYDLSSLRVCLAGGAALPLEVQRAFEARTGCRVLQGYGLSECSPVVTCNPMAGPPKPGSIGLPYPQTVVEIMSLERPARPRPIGEKGEICGSGPQVMAGYWRRPEETATTIVDGRLHTGDVGYMDDDGYFFIADRLKELINAAGFKVYPRMVEEAIHTHPAVAECAVIGVPDPYRGETVKAFVMLTAGRTLTAEALSAFLVDKLSPIEIPKQIEFRPALPKTAVGKIDKKALVAEGATKELAG